MNPPRALFVVGEPGGAAFLAPVARAWHGECVLLATPAGRAKWGSRREGSEVIAPSGNLRAAADLIAAVRPDVVVASASASPIEGGALLAAKARAIPVVQAVDSWYGYRRRLWATSEGASLPDALLVIDDESVERAVEEGIPGEIVEPIGHPGWEGVRPSQPGPLDSLLFAGQPIERLYGTELGFTEKTAWSTLREIELSRPELVRQLAYLRHPAESVVPSDPAPIGPCERSEAIVGAGTVVGMFSSLLVELALAGHRAISFRPDQTAAGARFAPPDIVRSVLDRASLIEALSEPVRDATTFRRSLVGSTARALRAIESLLGWRS